MLRLPDALAPLDAYPQFILYKLIRSTGVKTRKIPINPHTGLAFERGLNWQTDPTQWATAEQACAVAAAMGPDYGVGFLFCESDPFWLLDIDNALQPDNTWSPLAQSLCGQFAGAAVEVSQSGTGLHIIGSGAPPAHGCRNNADGLEFYHERRFVALTGINAIGSADYDCTPGLRVLVNQYFSAIGAAQSTGTLAERWQAAVEAGASPYWHGPADDSDLLGRILDARPSAATAFGTTASFLDLWVANAAALAACYPDEGAAQLREYDASAADAALAQHLAFWTGNNCIRMWTIMQMSALVRDKWDRDGYLQRTILRAISLQEQVYSDIVSTPRADAVGAPILAASSDKQRDAGTIARERALAACGGDAALASRLAQNGQSAAFWLDNQGQPPKALDALSQCRAIYRDTATRVDGYQYMTLDMQLEYFRGCVIVADQTGVLVPDGSILNERQFNLTYKGYEFQLDNQRGKTTTSAWKALTGSLGIDFPTAATSGFRPDLAPGEIYQSGGKPAANTYVPGNTRRVRGDAGPFLRHVSTLLPDTNDQKILLSYMAACVQYPGRKFTWAPFIQGAPGNGKTLLIKCMQHAIGEHLTHCPKIDGLADKFNSWMFRKLFIGIDDFHIPKHSPGLLEVLKDAITNNRQAERAMQQSESMQNNFANFMLNANDKQAVLKHRDDRRFAIFYTAQQSAEDIEAQGMDATYFNNLFDWLYGRGEYREGGENYGLAIIADYLDTYVIEDAYNPATLCSRAPATTSTAEAIALGGGQFSEIVNEAIAEGRMGFRGGWISSIALNNLLDSARLRIPLNRRTAMLESMGFVLHPGLPDGRASRATVVDGGGGRPKLYVRRGHLAGELVTSATIIQRYESAQSVPQGDSAHSHFL